MQQIKKWLDSSALYPVSQLFGHIQEPTAKQKKAEKRVAEICEELYKLEITTLSDVRAAYRDIEVLEIMNVQAKPEYVAKLCANLMYRIDKAVPVMDNMFKKDVLLQEYYKPWQIKTKDVKSLVIGYLLSKTGQDKACILPVYESYYLKVKEEDK